MARNPFVIAGTDLPASEQKAQGYTSTGALSQSASAIANAQGEINASSKKDAFQQVAATLQAAQKGLIVKNNSSREVLAQVANEIRVAGVTRNAANFGSIGEDVTNEIRTTVARTGFIRRFLQERELEAGQEAKILIRKNDVLSFIMAEDGQTPASFIKQRELYLRENYISTYVLIEEKELARLGSDLLEEKLEDAMESVMVAEDKQFKSLADAAAGALNTPTYFSALSPSVFQGLKNQVESRGLPVTSCWLANNLMNDIVADSSFTPWFDPVTKHELVLTGELGSLLGVTLHTDAFIQSQLRVLNAGEIYFFATPSTLGQFLVRKALESEPVNKSVVGVPERGWYLTEIVAPAIANANGVAKGIRL